MRLGGGPAGGHRFRFVLVAKQPERALLISLGCVLLLRPLHEVEARPEALETRRPATHGWDSPSYTSPSGLSLPAFLLRRRLNEPPSAVRPSGSSGRASARIAKTSLFHKPVKASKRVCQPPALTALYLAVKSQTVAARNPSTTTPVTIPRGMRPRSWCSPRPTVARASVAAPNSSAQLHLVAVRRRDGAPVASPSQRR